MISKQCNRNAPLSSVHSSRNFGDMAPEKAQPNALNQKCQIQPTPALPLQMTLINEAGHTKAHCQTHPRTRPPRVQSSPENADLRDLCLKRGSSLLPVPPRPCAPIQSAGETSVAPSWGMRVGGK